MDVLFLSPQHPFEMPRFTRGLVEVGARVWGVGSDPVQSLPPLVRDNLTGYLRTPNILDEHDVIQRIEAWLGGRIPDRVETLWEPLVVLAARLRERWGMPGLSVNAAIGFRDKGLMKQRAAAAGVRVPRARRASTPEQILSAAHEVGFPLVIKPISGAGSADTFRVDNAAELRSRLPSIRHVREVSVEEYVTGEELTWDAILVDGRVAYQSITSYMPKPLIARHEEWISPAQICMRDIHHPMLRPGLELGAATVAALGLRTGFAHLEWFLTPSGEAVLGEVGARSGGGRLVDQMNFTGDTNLFREWARVVCWHSFEGSTRRLYNTGAIFKRARGQGRVLAHAGLDSFLARHGEHVCGVELTPIGHPRRDWKNTLIGDGVIFVRHPDYGATLDLVHEAANTIELRCG